jgi:hypothetical protein
LNRDDPSDPFHCLPPLCSANQWYGDAWICYDNVENCSVTNTVDGCTTCKGDGVKAPDGTVPQVCSTPDCPSMSKTWYDVDWWCQDTIANCITPVNIEACSLCKGEGIEFRDSTSDPYVCNPPECGPNRWYSPDWICYDDV